MFEELMAKAIDKKSADKLSPTFPDIIRSLSPLQAKLIKSLVQHDQFADVLLEPKQNLIKQHVRANFSYDEFGGPDHHLTLIQNLEQKTLVATISSRPTKEGEYPDFEIPEGLQLVRMTYRLTMFGKWFASACVQGAMPTLAWACGGV